MLCKIVKFQSHREFVACAALSNSDVESVKIEDCSVTLKTVTDYLLLVNIEYDLCIPLRRKEEKFGKLTEFEWESIIILREERSPYRAIAARVEQFNRNFSGTVPQWRKFGSSGSTSTKQIKKLVVDDGRWRPHSTIDTCSAWRWMTEELLPGNWQHVFLLRLVY